MAEDAGFETAWLTDFYSSDAFVRMAAVGQATKKIGVGSGIALRLRPLAGDDSRRRGRPG